MKLEELLVITNESATVNVVDSASGHVLGRYDGRDSIPTHCNGYEVVKQYIKAGELCIEVIAKALKMKYSKGEDSITFDDFEDNTEEYGSYWVEMCPTCLEKYKSILGSRMDDGGTACATCSVEGCHNEADYYVDFDKNEVTFEESSDGA